MQTPASIRGVLALGLVGALIAIPTAAAFPLGVDAGSVGEFDSAGGHAAFAQTWVGPWMRSSGWGGFENDLRAASDAGATPVVLWNYWGDAITPGCVQNGCNGMSRGEWDAMASTLAQKANAVLGGRTFYVVLEPEFNKGGITGWAPFDGYLADQANLIRSQAPGAKVVLGFGSWGGYESFPRAAAASDLVGFQFMRASTRDAPSDAQAPSGAMISTAQTLRGLFAKPVLVFDVAIASYGGWEWVQQAAFRDLQARSGDLAAAGIVGVVWRSVHDISGAIGYYGPAENSFGVKRADGSAKSAWPDLVALSQGGGAPAPSQGLSFASVHGNEWWIEATVTGGPSWVSARVDGGPWMAMQPTSWGTWGLSAHAPAGSLVELQAGGGGAATITDFRVWSGFSAGFANVKGNGWWVQADVSANAPLVDVSASVNGGPWTPLALQWWGSWGATVQAPAGSSVQLRATSAAGDTMLSQAYPWSG